MSDANRAVITEFYQAFQRLDAEAMSACYSEDVLFSDPAFGELRGRDAGDMWRMLTTRAKDFSLTFDSVQADERSGSAHWVARYLFSQTGNTVVNDIQARFVLRDGKICEHHDSSPAMALVYTEVCRDKSEALRQERLIKKLRKSAKECLVAAYHPD